MRDVPVSSIDFIYSCPKAGAAIINEVVNHSPSAGSNTTAWAFNPRDKFYYSLTDSSNVIGEMFSKPYNTRVALEMKTTSPQSAFRYCDSNRYAEATKEFLDEDNDKHTGFVPKQEFFQRLVQNGCRKSEELPSEYTFESRNSEIAYAYSLGYFLNVGTPYHVEFSKDEWHSATMNGDFKPIITTNPINPNQPFTIHQETLSYVKTIQQERQQGTTGGLKTVIGLEHDANKEAYLAHPLFQGILINKNMTLHEVITESKHKHLMHQLANFNVYAHITDDKASGQNNISLYMTYQGKNNTIILQPCTSDKDPYHDCHTKGINAFTASRQKHFKKKTDKHPDIIQYQTEIMTICNKKATRQEFFSHLDQLFIDIDDLESNREQSQQADFLISAIIDSAIYFDGAASETALIDQHELLRQYFAHKICTVTSSCNFYSALRKAYTFNASSSEDASILTVLNLYSGGSCLISQINEQDKENVVNYIQSLTLSTKPLQQIQSQLNEKFASNPKKRKRKEMTTGAITTSKTLIGDLDSIVDTASANSRGTKRRRPCPCPRFFGGLGPTLSKRTKREPSKKFGM
jgi:hypothetical protein